MIAFIPPPIASALHPLRPSLPAIVHTTLEAVDLSSPALLSLKGDRFIMRAVLDNRLFYPNQEVMLMEQRGLSARSSPRSQIL
jgi:hypothetical protein